MTTSTFESSSSGTGGAYHRFGPNASIGKHALARDLHENRRVTEPGHAGAVRRRGELLSSVRVDRYRFGGFGVITHRRGVGEHARDVVIHRLRVDEDAIRRVGRGLHPCEAFASRCFSHRNPGDPQRPAREDAKQRGANRDDTERVPLPGFGRRLGFFGHAASGQSFDEHTCRDWHSPLAKRAIL